MSVASDHEGAQGDSLRVLPGDAAAGGPRCETARFLLAPELPAELPPQPPQQGLQPATDRMQFKHWTPEAQERALDLLRHRQLRPWRPFYCPNPECNGKPHDKWTWNHGRAEQRPPSMREEWLTWLLLGGRGGGKTRPGSEMTHRMAKRVPRMHLIAPTGSDLRETMVEGESGLQITAPPDFIPQWEPSKKKLTWPNGAIALGFSGEEPARLRGPQCYFAWIDEPGHMPLIGGEDGVWDNMLFGLRLGQSPRVVATTTPKPSQWLRDLIADPLTRISRFSTYANLDNLAPTFARTILQKYEGTRTGRQELHAEYLEDVAGSLWKQAMIRYGQQPEHFDRIVVGIDPAGTANRKSDATGIVVVALAENKLWVLADYTDKYTPSGWATKAVWAYHHWSADALVPEVNYGGDMVKEVLKKNGAENIRIKTVTSRRGKAIRAEPIVTLYEKDPPEVWHISDRTKLLEDEMTTWVPGKTDSPNRVDALVHAATELWRNIHPADIADPTKLSNNRRGVRMPNGQWLPQ